MKLEFKAEVKPSSASSIECDGINSSLSKHLFEDI
jgi:hypothetical protein